MHAYVRTGQGVRQDPVCVARGAELALLLLGFRGVGRGGGGGRGEVAGVGIGAADVAGCGGCVCGRVGESMDIHRRVCKPQTTKTTDAPCRDKRLRSRGGTAGAEAAAASPVEGLVGAVLLLLLAAVAAEGSLSCLVEVV